MSLKDAVAAKKARTTAQKEVALAEVSKEATKRLNVNVPASLLKQFKIAAATEDKDMTTLINQWIHEYVSK